MFKFYVNKEKGKTICVGNYNGKTVKGTAICSKNDVFEPVIGEDLAKARCMVNIAYLKFSDARKKFCEASNKVENANAELNEANKRWFEAQKDLSAATSYCIELTNSLN